MDYMNPTCPHCDSKKIIKQEYSPRTLKINNQNPITVNLRRYLCKSCRKKFTTSLKSIIKPKHKYPSLFMDKIVELYETGYRSLRNASEDLLNFFGVKISHQTIHNWLQILAETQKEENKIDYSGYYSYDEQYVKIKGVWMYRLTLFDQILNIPVNDKIYPNKGYNTIKQFIQESTKNIPVVVITTDHLREYKTIIDELGFIHQLCIFHLFKMIGDKLRLRLRSKKVSENEKTKLKEYYEEIQGIFNTNNYETAKQRFNKILSKFDNIPRLLQRFVTKKILPDFQRLTQFMHDPNISRTTNQVENYYRQTLPKAIKRIFKTPEGLSTYLKLKENKWTIKHRKKSNT
jgi:transposase-like protein